MLPRLKIVHKNESYLKIFVNAFLLGFTSNYIGVMLDYYTILEQSSCQCRG